MQALSAMERLVESENGFGLLDVIRKYCLELER